MISFIIAHYNTPELLPLCLSALEEAGDALGEEQEMIVVDGDTEPEHAMIVADATPTAQFVGVKRNVGYGGLVNRGLATARGRYCLVLNPDIILERDALRHLVSFLDAHPRVGLVGPQLRGFDGRRQESRFRFPTVTAVAARRTWLGRTGWGRRVLDRFLMRDTSNETAQPVPWLMGSVLLVRSEAYEEVGGMDERFFLYFEDVDWCRRMWENGYRVFYLPQAHAAHYHHRASETGKGIWDAIVNPLTRIHLRSFLQYLWKWRGKEAPQAW